MPWRLPFLKMHGAGNDFVMIDSRHIPRSGLSREHIVALCNRRLGIGADGLMVISLYTEADTPVTIAAGSNADDQTDFAADFAMAYYNADGGAAEMCGNGARCAVAFAHRLGLFQTECRFKTEAGYLAGKFVGEEVEVTLPPWRELKCHIPLEGSPFETHHFVDTGVPHLVIPVPDVQGVDLLKWGLFLRGHPALGAAGANVDWVLSEPHDGEFQLRTYERGVEGETLACGTGAAAVAVVLCQLGLATSPVPLRTWGGDRLVVTVKSDAYNPALRLRGPVKVSFAGEVEIHG